MKKRELNILWTTVFLLIFACTARGVDELVMESSWSENQTYPAIDGKYIVWEDYFSGSHYDIYHYDLSEKAESAIYTGAGNQRFPDISGNIVVWQDDRNGNWDIYAFDTTSGTPFTVCTASGDQQYPAISGNLIVWQDSRNASDDIYGYDLDTHTEIEICTQGSNQWHPDVSVKEGYLIERVVVWQDFRNGNWDIYYYDVDAMVENVISNQGDHQERPQIDMPRVVWQDDRSGNDDIYMFTFFSLPPATVIIENDPADQRYPAISGSTIVWQDFRNGSGDIYGGILGTLGTFSVCSDAAVQAYPAISGNFAVWHDYRDGGTSAYDIYGGALGADVWAGCGETLDFEFVLEYDAPDWTKITSHFDGVTFQSARPTCSGDTVIIDNPTSTESGICAIGNYGCEFIPGHLEMIFDDPQQAVTFYVGSYCGTYTINGYDAQSGGNVVYTETFDLSCDLTEHGVHRFVSVTSDTQNVSRIEIDNDWGIHVRIDDLSFNIDQSPPLVHIDEPGFHQCTCGIFPITGEVCDPDGDVTYLLKYQKVGDAPDAWTEIGTFSDQVCGSGLLGEWDTSGLSHGYYYLKLEATNVCDLSASDSTVAYVDKVFNTVEIRYPNPYDGNNGVVRGSNVCVDGTVWDNICYDNVNGYTINYAPAGSGSWLPVLPGPDGTNSVINDPYGRWDTTAVPDGDYDLRVTSMDICGNPASATVTTRVDNTAPSAQITSMTTCSYIPSGSGVIPINGIALDANIYSWILEYTGGSGNSWTTINSGTGNVNGGLLGNWNTTGLLPCAYTIRLRVWDQALANCSGSRNSAQFMVTVKVGADLNGDGCVDLLDFSLTASEWLLGCP